MGMTAHRRISSRMVVRLYKAVGRRPMCTKAYVSVDTHCRGNYRRRTGERKARVTATVFIQSSIYTIQSTESRARRERERGKRDQPGRRRATRLRVRLCLSLFARAHLRPHGLCPVMGDVLSMACVPSRAVAVGGVARRRLARVDLGHPLEGHRHLNLEVVLERDDALRVGAERDVGRVAAARAEPLR